MLTVTECHLSKENDVHRLLASSALSSASVDLPYLFLLRDAALGTNSGSLLISSAPTT